MKRTAFDAVLFGFYALNLLYQAAIIHMHFGGEILFFEMRELADYFEVRG